MKKQILFEEFYRMQFLAGIITETQYTQYIKEFTFIIVLMKILLVISN